MLANTEVCITRLSEVFPGARTDVQVMDRLLSRLTTVIRVPLVSPGTMQTFEETPLRNVAFIYDAVDQRLGGDGDR